MWSNEPRSLPGWIEEAYEVLVVRAAAADGSLPEERARELLVDEGTFPGGSSDAEYAIERLLDTGWLYRVEGELRITDPE